MAVRIKGGEGQLWVEVDDRDAVWPVTIDPTFTQQETLVAPDAAESDYFGYSVALSGDTVVVGAMFHDGAAAVDQGSAYVFVRSAGVWTLQQKLVAADAASRDQFGTSVAISGDTVVVGARFDLGAHIIGHGSAYVFVRSGGVWSQQQKLLPADAVSGDGFGYSVAISGETIVVSAPFGGTAVIREGAAYVFVRSAGVWSQQQKLLAADAAVI